MAVSFWREPLTSLCAAITEAGFLIERIVEPVSRDSMRALYPDEWRELHDRPGFIVLDSLDRLSNGLLRNRSFGRDRPMTSAVRPARVPKDTSTGSDTVRSWAGERKNA